MTVLGFFQDAGQACKLELRAFVNLQNGRWKRRLEKEQITGFTPSADEAAF